LVAADALGKALGKVGHPLGHRRRAPPIAQYGVLLRRRRRRAERPQRPACTACRTRAGAGGQRGGSARGGRAEALLEPLEREEISEIAQQWLFHHAVFGAVDAERGRAIDLMRGAIRGHQGN